MNVAGKNPKILFLSAELAPLAKVGGLGDVAGSLPKELSGLGIDIRIIIPFYGCIKLKPSAVKKVGLINVLAGNKMETAEVYRTDFPGTTLPVYLIKHKMFDSDDIYTGLSPTKKSSLNQTSLDIKRFAFFCRASLEAAALIGFCPDIIHANDWHTAIASDLVKDKSYKQGFFKNTKTLYTIHNLANQGISGPEIIGYSKIDPNLGVIKNDLKDGDMNLMVQGILGSDLINTVSPAYSREILLHYQGAGLDNILRKRKKDLYGILNGIDTGFFNPETDKFIASRYSVKTLSKKIYNKTGLQKKLRLTGERNTAMIALVSRLVWQKGLDLINEWLISEILKSHGCQFIFLGTGDKRIEAHLKKLEKKYPGRFKAMLSFDAPLAQQIYAGADIFLMPSRFEPCGLGQMIAMRYGTVPVVRATGGLKDTVSPKVGFSFNDYTSSALYNALKKALDIYYNKPDTWRRLQINGMKKDFSWNKSAKEYLRLYKKLIT